MRRPLPLLQWFTGAGIGKTRTALRYQDANASPHSSNALYMSSGVPTVYMVEAHASMRTITSALCAISEAMGRGDDAYRCDAMVRQITRAFNPGDLLIVDEAQHLDIKALDQIRHFHDACHIGIAYLGNEEIHTRINGRGKQAAFMGPLSSRVGMRMPIPLPTEGDALETLKAWGIGTGKDEVEYATRIVKGGGGLRALTQVLRQAALIARDKNWIIDVRVMRAASTNLGYNI